VGQAWKAAAPPAVPAAALPEQARTARPPPGQAQVQPACRKPVL